MNTEPNTPNDQRPVATDPPNVRRLGPGVYKLQTAGLVDVNQQLGCAPDAAALLLQVHTAPPSPPTIPAQSQANPHPMRVLAVGTRAHVAQHPAWQAATRIELPQDAVLLPGLVNAHTHLDLTHIGPKPYDPGLGFMGWAMMIVRERLTQDTDIARSVAQGVRLSLAGGVVAVGDIAGFASLVPRRVCAHAGLLGVSFLEFFGIGEGEAESTKAMRAKAAAVVEKGLQKARISAGLSPHAPYTAGLTLQKGAAEAQQNLAVRTSTHLAEMPAEREFIAKGTGPARELLETLGVWDDSALKGLGQNKTPIAHMADVLAAAPQLVAHVNDANDDDIHTLVRTNTSVAYNPRSSSYFLNHEHFGPHRYQHMLESGVNVCLGTDSIVNIAQNEAHRLSTLDEMRFLYKRDKTPPTTLVRMATTNGAKALGLEPHLFTFKDESAEKSAAPIAGVCVVSGAHAAASDAATAVMESQGDLLLLMPQAVS